MKKYLILLLLALTLLLSGCNSITRNYGGTQTINLPEGQKLINVTWKEDSLWVLTKKMTDEDVAETYEFKEDSNFGVLEGTVILKESK